MYNPKDKLSTVISTWLLLKYSRTFGEFHCMFQNTTSKLQNKLNYTDLSSWHGFGIHGVMFHRLAHFTKGQTQHFPDGALP